MADRESEFGKGLTYCIGLFLAHAERKLCGDGDIDYGLWFNSSSDHLYELDTLIITDDDMKKRIEEWKHKVIHWGHGFSPPYATKEDFQWSIEQAKGFLLEIDGKIMGVDTIKGSYE